MGVQELVVAEALGVRRAREELGLDPAEFEVALQVGEIRTTSAAGGRRRVVRKDVERLRSEEGFPETLRERLRLVGSVEGGELIGITRDRFTRLAKGGLIRPVRWYVNRYRAVVWLYLAEEVRQLAVARPSLLAGRLPTALRDALDEGEDHRPRGWRARRVEEMVRDATDAWGEAAAWAALLGPEAAARAVPDPHERAYLRRLRPGIPPGNTGTHVAREMIDAIVVADRPDEVAFAQVSLSDALLRARAARPAPRPGNEQEPALAVLVAPPDPAAPPGPTGPPQPPPRATRSRWRRLLGLGAA
ncbi:DUF6397 family protein [Streptomyces sp. MI02-7b]|uniref:DUF6397 family protein n=1 Tax=Streptomyces sp. MI02-7b TaxID=462941 RepID=UPI0029AAEA4B|nr:DUF6397 family protein [Streptomyces sp. MI02-7b]MDX3071496.1 DUF6397 family protein [Streptomyces sp. MI02-7b]